MHDNRANITHDEWGLKRDSFSTKVQGSKEGTAPGSSGTGDHEYGGQ
jgi:hypothetical protein